MYSYMYVHLGPATSMSAQCHALHSSEQKCTTVAVVHLCTFCCVSMHMQLGVQPFQSVIIAGFNAPQWHVSALGAIFAG